MIPDARIPLGVISLDYSGWRECIDAASSYGLPLAEIYITPDFSAGDAQEMVSHAAKRGVAIHSVSCIAKLALAESTLSEEVALVKACMEVAARAQSPFVTFMYGGSTTLSPWFCRDRFIDRMEPLLARSGELGVHLLLENVFSRSHGGDLDTVDRSLSVLTAFDGAVGLNLDFGNFAIAGEEAYPFAFEALSSYVRACHLKDVARYRPSRDGNKPTGRPLLDHSRGRFVSVPLGSGCLNSQGILLSLASMKAAVPVMLEPSYSGATRDEWMQRSLRYLHRVLA